MGTVTGAELLFFYIKEQDEWIGMINATEWNEFLDSTFVLIIE